MPGSLVSELKRRRYWVVAWLAISVLMGAIVVIKYPPLGQSTMQFYVEDNGSATSSLVPVDVPTPEVRKLFHLATSTRALDHLIEKYKLLERYGIADGRPFPREVARKRLLAHMEVRMVDRNAIKVEVRDRDRLLAADLANELFRYLQAKAENETRADLRQAARVQERVYRSLDERSVELEEEVRELLADPQLGSLDPDVRMKVGISFEQVLGQMSRSREDLLNAYRAQQLALGLMGKEFTRPLVLLRRAGPDMSMDARVQGLLRLLLIVSSSMVFFVVVLIAWLKNADALRHAWERFDKLEDRSERNVPARTKDDSGGVDIDAGAPQVSNFLLDHVPEGADQVRRAGAAGVK